MQSSLPIARGIAALLLFALLAAFPPESPARQTDAADPRRPALGVAVQPVPFPRLEELRLPYGVKVRTLIPGGPAEEAGVRPGDLITALDGAPVYSPARLEWLMRKREAGKPVALELVRGEEQTTLQVEPRPLPRPGGSPSARAGGSPDTPYLGIRMQALTPGLRERVQAPEQGGVLVADVKQDGPAAQAGIQPGDLILRIDRRQIGGIGDIYRAVNFFDPGDRIQVEVMRNAEKQTVEVALGERVDAGPQGGLPPQHGMQPPGPGPTGTPRGPSSQGPQSGAPSQVSPGGAIGVPEGTGGAVRVQPGERL